VLFDAFVVEGKLRSEWVREFAGRKAASEFTALRTSSGGGGTPGKSELRKTRKQKNHRREKLLCRLKVPGLS